MGTGIGIGLGQGIAGYLGPTFGWRVPFLVVSIPALITATLIVIFVKEPERGKRERSVEEQEIDDGTNFERIDHLSLADMGASDSSTAISHNKIKKSSMDLNFSFDHDPTDSWKIIEKGKYVIQQCYNGLRYTFQATCLLFRSKTFFLLLIQGIPGCIPWGIVNSFLTDYLAQEQGMSVEVRVNDHCTVNSDFVLTHFSKINIKGATSVNMMFGVGVFLGMAVGGALGNRLYSLSPAHPSVLAGSTTILGCIPFLVMLNNITSSSNFATIFIITMSAGLLTGIAGPIVKGTVMNVTDPRHRGQAFALTTTFDDLGRGLGPFIISRIISLFDGNRMRAFNTAVSAWIICGLLNLMVYFTVIEDENKVNLRLNAIQLSTDYVT